MKSKVFKSGMIYTVPLADIEYIGYFYAKNGNEAIKSAMKRITEKQKRVPDFLMNAELFDFATRAAASDVVENGTIHRLTESYGFAFPNNSEVVFSYKNNVAAKDYVGAYPTLVRAGKAEVSNPVGISGKRGRTALGLSDDALYIALVPDGNNSATLSELRDVFISNGAVNAINLDGGGSTQFYAPCGNYFSGRKVRGFIGIWLLGNDVRYVNVKNYLNIRSGPAVYCKRVGKLRGGDEVTVMDERNGWAKIPQGWVSARYLRKRL